MYTVIVDNIKKNEFNVLGLLCTVLYGKKKMSYKLYLKATIHEYD